MSGVTVYQNAFIQSDGTLQLNGSYQGTNGNTDTLTVSATQNVVVLGTSVQSVLCDGTLQQWSANLSPVGGSWQTGSAVGVAVLVDGLSVDDGTQNLSVYHA